MKSLIKKIISYDKIYHFLKTSILYHFRKQLNGQIANTIYGHPSKDFFVIGVTGTNGKTTTVNLIHKILNDCLGKTMMISTANIKIGNKEIKNIKKMTSLDIYDLQSTLAIAKDAGCKIAVLETSSHGLDQYRFEGVNFDCGVLTNITHDHLDYHKTMDEYAKAKKKLFTYIMHNEKNHKYAILPSDDPYGKKRFEEFAFDKKISYSIHTSGFLKAENVQQYKEKTTFDINYLGKSYSITTHLVGLFNVYNILAALGVALEIGVNIEKAIASIQEFIGVEGRMQRIDHKEITAYIDFAHTPDGLEKALSYLKMIKGKGRLITTFGAPGVRDKEKRPIMGQIAADYSDIVIITDDDPDTENRLQIIDQIQKGISNKILGKDLFIIPERTLAIEFATNIAQPGDILMFAGKGHESIQFTNTGKRPWSDFEEVKKRLK
ncbi:UDP-N-acetylmuramoyl-L-alanyl-D-glutamate-2,6-diaminopimelate ligase [candidate division SR1 bacterium RAAC1_SR1_1]|nr:UDP-N-acetylmuramoyl-L-alanyl-D-glutamate-2,6-diaminopimelate ligase [candidate division SR1 bacterium RAAC1_SR1_1]